jgi:hypothetical protein
MQWRKLAILIVVALVLVGVSVTWSIWRRGNALPPLPALVPGAHDLQAPR